MIKRYLMAPGPTPVAEETLLEMAKPIVHHRTSDFSQVFSKVRKELQAIFNTLEEIIILLSSGTGAMEASVVNTLSANDEVLVIDAGKFGARWAEICKAYNVKAHILKYDWGKSASVDDVKRCIENNKNIKAVLTQGSETSTTTSHPIEQIGRYLKDKNDVIFIVDGITSVGVSPVKTDEWGIDVLVTGSQKAFMLPPGLAFISLSKKAWEFYGKSTLPKFYFDLRIELKNQIKNTTAWTPGVSLIYGLSKSLDLMNKEGLDNVYKRHSVCALATREALKSLGLELMSKGFPSNAATGFILPSGIDGIKFENYLREKVGITIAGGQDSFKGKLIRISHLGYHDYFDTIIVVSAIEMALKLFGYNFELGKGVKAAEEVFIHMLPNIS